MHARHVTVQITFCKRVSCEFDFDKFASTCVVYISYTWYIPYAKYIHFSSLQARLTCRSWMPYAEVKCEERPFVRF